MTNGPSFIGLPDTTAILAPAGSPAAPASIHFMVLAWAGPAAVMTRLDSPTITRRCMQTPFDADLPASPVTTGCECSLCRVVAPPSETSGNRAGDCLRVIAWTAKLERAFAL